LHAASLALAASRPDLIDTVIGEKVPIARDVLLKELGRRRERVRGVVGVDLTALFSRVTSADLLLITQLSIRSHLWNTA
jgi:hypothetical protein